TVATAFPSRNHGAIVAALDAPDDGSSVGGAHLSYRPEAALVGVSDDASDDLVAMGAAPPPVDQSGVAVGGPGVGLSAVLVNQAEEMKRGCDAYWAGHVDDAVAITTELRDYLQAEENALTASSSSSSSSPPSPESSPPNDYGVGDELALVQK